jgi:hypothetical protein
MKKLLPIIALMMGCASVQPSARLGVPGLTKDGEIVDSMGIVTIQRGDDLETTRRRALVTAQYNAVEMVLGVKVSNHTMTEKSALELSTTNVDGVGHIKRYDILKDYQKRNTYTIEIRALVVTDPQ